MSELDRLKFAYVTWYSENSHEPKITTLNLMQSSELKIFINDIILCVG